MWTITKIEEADFGCEERLPGEPLMVLVTIESEDGEVLKFEVADNWISLHGLDEGDEWPEEIDEEDTDSKKASNQSEWMENYYCALEEINKYDECY